MSNKVNKILKFPKKLNPATGATNLTSYICITPVTAIEKLQYTLNRFWKSGQFLNTIPFHFDSTRNALIPSPFIPYRLVWSAFLFLYLLDILYMSQISSTVTFDIVSEEEFVNFYVHFITRIIAGVFSVYLSLNVYDISQFTQFLFSMIKKCEFNTFEAKRFQYFFQANLVFVHIQPLLSLILHLQSRHSPRYWPSQFLEMEIYDSFFVAASYAVLDLYFSSIGVWGTFYCILPVMCYNFLGQHWMQQLR